MRITPVDVRRKEFGRAMRGYDANQVDDFLDEVADEFERVYSENSRMRDELDTMKGRLEQFEELEGTIREALVHAQQSAEDLRRTVSKEAELTVREAKARSHQILAETHARVERIQESYEAMRKAKQDFAGDFRHLLKSYLDVMDNMDITSAKEIERSLNERLDTESLGVAREAAEQHRRDVVERSQDTAPIATGQATDRGPAQSGFSERDLLAESGLSGDGAGATPGADPRSHTPASGLATATGEWSEESGSGQSPLAREVVYQELPQDRPQESETAASETATAAEAETTGGQMNEFEPEATEPKVEPSSAPGEPSDRSRKTDYSRETDERSRKSDAFFRQSDGEAVSFGAANGEDSLQGGSPFRDEPIVSDADAGSGSIGNNGWGASGEPTGDAAEEEDNEDRDTDKEDTGELRPGEESRSEVHEQQEEDPRRARAGRFLRRRG